MTKEKDSNMLAVASKNTKDYLPSVGIGSIVEGKVVARDRSALFIDLGNQGTGIIYGREFYGAKDTIKGLNIGDTVFAKIVEMENEDGYRELSMMDAAKELNWKNLEDLKSSQETIPVKITGVNKGGLLTTLNGMQAFLPVSQLSPENYPRVIDADKAKILKELQKFIGKTLEVKVLDVLAKEKKLILSEKAKSEEKLRQILQNYKKGDIIEGKITGIADFGAFIKFPIKKSEDTNTLTETSDKVQEVNEEIEGLIHISELDWQLVQNPSEVVKVGEEVKAQIINIQNSQVFLSLKSLKQNPWEEIEKQYKKDDVIKGKVMSFSPFGAFVEVMPKIRGLCHISEFTGQKEMEDSLKVGETYDFKIMEIIPKEHRLSLKLVSSK